MTARLLILLAACRFAPVREPLPGGAAVSSPRVSPPPPDPCDRPGIVAPMGRALCRAERVRRR